MLTSVYTIHTGDTAGIIYRMIFIVNAGRFALTRAKAARIAFVRIDNRAEQ